MAEEDYKTLFNHHCIPGLEAVLRTTMGNDLVLENYNVNDLLPAGENYGSLILSIDAKFNRKGKESKCEELHMIAKTPPLTHWQRILFDSPNSFKKEIFMYETILPKYKEIELQCGINEKEIFDIAPVFFGSRLNLDFGHDFDDDAIILLENLKPRGYYIGNRHTGLDIHHSRLAIQAVARFHALGIAIKTKNPDFFEELKIRSRSTTREAPKEEVEFSKYIYRMIKEDPVTGEHYDFCAKALDSFAYYVTGTVESDDPWATIIHYDLWVNNIMFHQNEETGMPDDVKIIDYQNYLVQSPLRDLCFMLGTLVNQEVGTKYIPELIDLYHKNFISRLDIMGCDLSPYTRDKFDQQLSKDALVEFTHIAQMLKITTRIPDPNISKTVLPVKDMFAPGTDEFYGRMRAFVTGYAKRGWFEMISQIDVI